MRNSTDIEMTIILIRHGETLGNAEKRYIGRTDEPLSEAGRKAVAENAARGKYPPADVVFSSPMKRCLETALLIYPDKTVTAEENLKEIDFGIFEGKSYNELSGTALYQQWIESNGTLPFPEGEARESFISRTVSAFDRLVLATDEPLRNIAFVVHGGSIMAILSVYCGGNYFDWQCKNGEGYVCTAVKSDSGLSFSGCRRL